RAARHAALHSFPTRRSSDLVLLAAVAQPLVVVVHRDRQRALGGVLADHVLVEDRADLGRRRQLALLVAAGAIDTGLVTNDVVAKDRKSTRLNSSHVKISYAV